MVSSYIMSFINIFFNLYSFLIIVRVLLSWVPGKLPLAIEYFIRDVTDPVMKVVKRVVPPIGMLDLSPMVALIGLGFIKNILLKIVSLIF